MATRKAFSVTAIPEIRAVDDRRFLIRIPGEMDVPITPRIRKLIDSRPFRRLAGIRQLGLVSLVYPGATHSRFEHSLGVYHNALQVTRRLAGDESFSAFFESTDVEKLLVAALLHDIGHWSYCHPIEDLETDWIPRHEVLARKLLEEEPLASLLRKEFDIDPAEIATLLDDGPASPTVRLSRSVLSGPIDVDKLDYLYRDSLHCGVPYGAHFDRQRLIGSLCIHPHDCRLAINEKGSTAAELMVFARYVMFSEVYWHHTVRSATAMLQRAVSELHDRIDWKKIFRADDAGFRSELARAGADGRCADLVNGVMGEERRLYKQVGQCNFMTDSGTFRFVSRRPYAELTALSRQLAESLAGMTGMSFGPDDLLIDASPPGLEVQFHIPVRQGNPGESGYRWLGDVSPVVKTLADHQFDSYVKRVRVFAHPRIAGELRAFRVESGGVMGELARIARQNRL
jgi:uncharacterized protein